MDELSPLDILSKSFRKKFKGYDQVEVYQFLTEVAGIVEQLLRDRGELKQEVVRLERSLREYRERESALQDALVAAQKSAEKTVTEAKDQAQKILEEGQVLAGRLVEEAHERARNIEVKISDLRGQRREMRAELMRLVELLQGLVDDDKQRERAEPTTPQLAILQQRKTHSEGNA